MTKRAMLLAALAAAVTGCAKSGNDVTMHHDSPTRSQFEAMKDPPITADTHFAAAQLAESREAYEQAFKQYQIALKLNPKHLGALYAVACLHTRLKQFPDAINFWHRYVQASGNSAVGYSDLAYCEELAGNPSGAEADYQRGIEKDPRNEACRVNYGLMLARHGRISEATIQFQAVLTPAEVHYNLASVYESQGHKEEARAEYRKSVELDPNLADAKAKLADLN